MKFTNSKKVSYDSTIPQSVLIEFICTVISPNNMSTSSIGSGLYSVEGRELSIKSFVGLLISSTSCPTNLILNSLVYINRLKQIDLKWFATKSPALILTISLMLAYKYLEDSPYFSESWAKVSGIDIALLNKSEREVLAKMRYTLYVTKSLHKEWSDRAFNFYKNITISRITKRRLSSPNGYLPYSQSSRSLYKPTITSSAPIQDYSTSFMPMSKMITYDPIDLSFYSMLPNLTFPQTYPEMDFNFNLKSNTAMYPFHSKVAPVPVAHSFIHALTMPSFNPGSLALINQNYFMPNM